MSQIINQLFLDAHEIEATGPYDRIRTARKLKIPSISRPDQREYDSKSTCSEENDLIFYDESYIRINQKWVGIWPNLVCFICLYFLLGQAQALSCWRDTPCSSITEAAFPGDWDSNIYAPSSRTVSPKFILSAGTGQTISSYPGAGNLTGNGSSLVFDFGMEVGGVVTINYTVSGSGPGAIGLAFTEAKNWIGERSDEANCNGQDGAFYVNFLGPGDNGYTMPVNSLRGGFRYLTVFLVSDLDLDHKNLSLSFSFSPMNTKKKKQYRRHEAFEWTMLQATE